MKQCVCLLLFTVLFIGCSKDNDQPKYNEQLVGKSFRAKAWFNEDGFGQVYDVFEFTSNDKVINEYRLSDNTPVNKDNRVILDWRKDGSTGTSIIVKFRRFTDAPSETKEIRGTITDGILSFSDKVGETVYEEY